MSERLDRVQVVTSNGTVVEITSAGRDALVAQLQLHEQQVGFELSIFGLETFVKAGASGPVNLGRRDLASVIAAIGTLAERVGGARHLEPGVAELERVLTKELRAAQDEEDAQWAAEHPEVDMPWAAERASRSAPAKIVLLAGLLWLARSVSKRVTRPYSR